MRVRYFFSLLRESFADSCLYLFKKFQGSVTLQVTGESGIKFLNICTHRNIKVWNVKNIDENQYYVTMSLYDFKHNVRSVARKARCRVKVVNCCGAGITMWRYRRRRALLIGSAVCLALIVYFSSVFWNVSITGGDAVSRAKTRELLMDAGIHPGTFCHTVDPFSIADALLRAQEDSLAWVGVTRVGTTLQVELVSGIFYREESLFPANESCDIVAEKDCVITKLIVDRGTPLVKVGDVVTAGQILVSGTVPLANDFATAAPTEHVHASAQIEGLVQYTVSEPVTNEQKILRQTGRIEKSYVFYLPGFSVKWPFGASSFESFSQITTDSFATLPGVESSMPFGLRKITQYETVLEIKTMEFEEAVLYTKNRATKAMDDLIPDTAKIVDTFSEVRSENETTFVYVNAQCIEEIGTEAEPSEPAPTQAP